MVAEATSVDDVFVRLEAAGELRRIDPAVTPEAYHCAILSDGELTELRRIHNVVRLGHVDVRRGGGASRSFTKLARTRLGVDVEATGHLQRYLHRVGPAAAKLDQLLRGGAT